VQLLDANENESDPRERPEPRTYGLDEEVMDFIPKIAIG
jgi:hypothetical protein